MRVVLMARYKAGEQVSKSSRVFALPEVATSSRSPLSETDRHQDLGLRNLWSHKCLLSISRSWFNTFTMRSRILVYMNKKCPVF